MGARKPATGMRVRFRVSVEHRSKLISPVTRHSRWTIEPKDEIAGHRVARRCWAGTRRPAFRDPIHPCAAGSTTTPGPSGHWGPVLARYCRREPEELPALAWDGDGRAGRGRSSDTGQEATRGTGSHARETRPAPRPGEIARFDALNEQLTPCRILIYLVPITSHGMYGPISGSKCRVPAAGRDEGAAGADGRSPAGHPAAAVGRTGGPRVPWPWTPVRRSSATRRR